MSGARTTECNDGTQFRLLGYYFTLRWNEDSVGRSVRRVLGRFEVAPDPAEDRYPPTPNVPPVYTVADAGSSQRPRWRLWYGDGLLADTPAFAAVLDHLFWHVNTEAMRQTGDYFIVHAGAVVSPGGEGLVLPSDSGGGKSTLVAALVRTGFGYLSDEAAAFDPVTRRLHPFPKALTLKRGAFELFRDLAPRTAVASNVEQWHVTPDELRPGSSAGPCDLGWVVTVRFEEGAATALSPMSRAETATDLAPSLPQPAPLPEPRPDASRRPGPGGPADSPGLRRRRHHGSKRCSTRSTNRTGPWTGTSLNSPIGKGTLEGQRGGDR